MWIEKLDVSGWRNHDQSTVLFSPGTTLLVGPNGQGKTNIVEALYFLGTLGSHRVSGSGALIGDGRDTATIYADLRHGDRTVSVGLTVKRRGSTDAAVNGVRAKPSDIPYWVSVVMFAPEDISIVRGEPSARRAFMDQLVISAAPAMSAVYQDFDRVVKQRNSLLKSLRLTRGISDSSTLEVWNEKFVALGAHIVTQRNRYLSEVMPRASAHYSALASADTVGFRYLPSFPHGEEGSMYMDRSEVETTLTAEISRRRSDEIDRGQTLVGPQRDDVELTIAGKPARTHASQGETWSVALSLRLATASWLREARSSGDPIIVLDDVFAELDAHRRAKLVGLVSDYQQILITSAVEEDVPDVLTGTVFDVRAGVVVPR